MISRKSISEVLDLAKVEEVVEEFVSLKRRGANMLGLCPFHNEKTPSFTVSPSKNIYKCFGCGRGGHAVSFVMEHENYSFPEAIRFLAKKYNIQLEEREETPEDLEAIQEKESFFIINEFAKDFFHQQLLNTDEGKSVGLSYYKDRGLLLSTMTEFQLGYSPSEAKALVDLASEKGYKEEFLSKLGLKTKNGLDFFRSRIIFPITNLSGKVIAFGGRTLSQDAKIPKYLNSAESEIYVKSNSLYGIFQAKNEIRRSNNCYLVEGYTDVLSLHQNGVKNVVASSGTSLTEGQLRIIKRFSSVITFLYDGDDAGQKAALRGLPLALDQDFDVKVVPFPERDDPDSLMQSLGADAFVKMLQDSALDFIIYQAKSIATKFADHPIEKSQAIKELLNSLSHIKETLKRALYIKELSKILEIDEKSVLGELNKNIRKIVAAKRRKVREVDAVHDEDSQLAPISDAGKQIKFQKTDYYQEKDIIRILILDGHKFIDEENVHTVADFIIENLRDVMDLIEYPLFKKVMTEFADSCNKTSGIGLNYFVNHSDRELSDMTIELAQQPYEYANWSEQGVELQTQKPKEENFEKDSKQAVLRFKLRKLALQIDKVLAQLKSETIDDQDKEVLLVTYHKIMDYRKSIADDLGAIVLS